MINSVFLINQSIKSTNQLIKCSLNGSHSVKTPSHLQNISNYFDNEYLLMDEGMRVSMSNGIHGKYLIHVAVNLSISSAFFKLFHFVRLHLLSNNTNQQQKEV